MKSYTVTAKSLLLTTAVAAALASLSAQADEVWKGGTSTQWIVGANWNNNGPPGANEAAVFNSQSTANRNTVLGADFSIGSIVLSNAPGPVSIGGANTLTLTPSTVNGTLPPVGINLSNALQSLTITAPLSLGNTQVWAVASGQALDVSGNISGVGGLYKDALGTLTLEGANTFAGNFTNNGGSVWINNSSALGTGTKTIYICNNNVGAGLHLNGTNGNLTLPGSFTFLLSQNQGGIFNEAGDNTINGGIYVFSGGGFAYLLANAGSLTLNGTIGLQTSSRAFQVGGAGKGTNNGPITAGLAFTKTDSGTWTLNGHNTYNGATVIQGGTLVLGTNATLQSTPSITILSNAVLDASAVSNANSGTVGFYLNYSGLAQQTLAGNGGVVGTVRALYPAALVPGASNSVGTLSFSNSLSLANMTCSFELNTPTIPGSGINDLVNVGGDIDPAGSTLFVTALSPLTSPGTYRLFNYQGAELNSFSSVYLQTDTRYTFGIDDQTTTNQVNLIVNGSNANLVWSGGYGPYWDLMFNANPNWNGNSDYFYNADDVVFDDTSSNPNVTVTGPVRPGSLLVNNNAVNYSFGGTSLGKITGPISLTKAGSGTLVLGGSNDFTGPLVINGGTVAVSSFATSGTGGPFGAGTNITLNGGTFQFGGARPAAGVVNRSWTLGPNGGTIVSTNQTFFLANQISGPGSLIKSGSVQVILGDINTGVLSTGASNSYSGNTYITQGELQVRNNHALGFGKAVVSNGADLSFGGGVNYGTCTNNIDLNGGDGNGSGGALQVNDSNTSVTYAGTINLLANSSVGSLSTPAGFTISGPIIGPGMLTKQNKGSVTVVLTCPTNSYSGGTAIVGGTLQLGAGGSCGGLGSGAVTNGGTLAYNHSDSITNSSLISGVGNLTHTGTGTLTLGGANTYSGSTTVNGGTLLVNGSLAAGAVTVGNSATLGGSGVINGPVTCNSGSTLGLGNAISVLTVNNVLNLGGTTMMKVSHATAATNDSVRGITTLTMGGGLTVTASGSLQGGDTFRLFNAATYAGAFTSTNLPSLGTGLAWDTTGLTNGTLKVISTFVPQPTLNAPLHRTDGNLQLTFSGQAGSNYRVWATTNLLLQPITSTWTQLSSGTFNGAPVTFTDLQATNFSKRFYLISIP